MFQMRSSSCPAPHVGIPEALTPCLMTQKYRLALVSAPDSEILRFATHAWHQARSQPGLAMA